MDRQTPLTMEPVSPVTGPQQVPPALQVSAVPGIGEVQPGTDLVGLLTPLLQPVVDHGDIVVITSKVVSKAEGRIIPAVEREAAIERETIRVVATKVHAGGVTRIVENRQGLVQAAAGIDASNTPDGTCLLLPEDPDRSARRLCQGLRDALDKHIGVVMTDTMGRPWRMGQTDVAIGAAGVVAIDDLAGSTDSYGHPLRVTAAAVADEVAGAANLVLGKSSQCPVALVRGLDKYVGSLDLPGATSLRRDPEEDLFRTGTQEAWAAGFVAGTAAGSKTTKIPYTGKE